MYYIRRNSSGVCGIIREIRGVCLRKTVEWPNAKHFLPDNTEIQVLISSTGRAVIRLRHWCNIWGSYLVTGL